MLLQKPNAEVLATFEVLRLPLFHEAHEVFGLAGMETGQVESSNGRGRRAEDLSENFVADEGKMVDGRHQAAELELDDGVDLLL